MNVKSNIHKDHRTLHEQIKSDQTKRGGKENDDARYDHERENDKEHEPGSR